MRDGITLARKGLASVALVTEAFWEQGNFVARASGMPDIPRVQLPHPTGGTGGDAMSDIAESVADDIVARLATP